MGAGHSHALSGSQNDRALRLALLLTTTFMNAEVINRINPEKEHCMNLKKHRLLATLSALVMSMPAFAADDHRGHDHAQKKGAAHAHDAKPLYGGIVTVVKDIHYELVARPDSIALYIADPGKPVEVKSVDALGAAVGYR